MPPPWSSADRVISSAAFLARRPVVGVEGVEVLSAAVGGQTDRESPWRGGALQIGDQRADGAAAGPAEREPQVLGDDPADSDRLDVVDLYEAVVAVRALQEDGGAAGPDARYQPASRAASDGQ